jgi:hypothetical protein
MRIDDCTLLLLRVVAEAVEESEPDLQPDRSDEAFVLHGAESVETVIVLEVVAAEQVVQDGSLAEVVPGEATTATNIPGDLSEQATLAGSANCPVNSIGDSQTGNTSSTDQKANAFASSTDSAEFPEPSPAAGADEENAPPDAQNKSWLSRLFSN